VNCNHKKILGRRRQKVMGRKKEVPQGISWDQESWGRNSCRLGVNLEIEFSVKGPKKYSRLVNFCTRSRGENTQSIRSNYR